MPKTTKAPKTTTVRDADLIAPPVQTMSKDEADKLERLVREAERAMERLLEEVERLNVSGYLHHSPSGKTTRTYLAHRQDRLANTCGALRDSLKHSDYGY